MREKMLKIAYRLEKRAYEFRRPIEGMPAEEKLLHPNYTIYTVLRETANIIRDELKTPQPNHDLLRSRSAIECEHCHRKMVFLDGEPPPKRCFYCLATFSFASATEST